MKKVNRVVLGEGVLGINRDDGITKGGFTIPTGYGIWDKKSCNWKKLKGVRMADKRVRLIAEILDTKEGL